MHIRTFTLQDQAAVIALWQACGLTRAWNDPAQDIARKMTVQPELFLVGTFNEEVIASVMAGYEGHRAWVNYLAVSPNHQRQSHARQLMREVERLLHERGCPKVNLQIRSNNAAVIAFYRHIGYGQDDVVSMGRRLIVDAPPNPALSP
jgi:ribosomal protein S18 acetylase RimI-like enzyme